jgi:hypothetical protein
VRAAVETGLLQVLTKGPRPGVRSGPLRELLHELQLLRVRQVPEPQAQGMGGEGGAGGRPARNTPLEERRVQLEAEIPRLQGEIDFLKIQHLSQEEITSAAEDLATRWFDLSLEERRAIVQATVELVTVGRGEIEFSPTYLPSEPPSAPALAPLPRSSQKGHEPLGV